MTNHDNDKRALVATICWSLWKERNEVVWNKKYSRAYVVIAKAKQYLEHWKFAQSKISVSRFPTLTEGDGSSVWVRPQETTIMVFKVFSGCSNIQRIQFLRDGFGGKGFIG